MVCKRCGRRDVTMSPYLALLVWLRRLRLGGFRLGNNDLPLEIWEDLGELEEHLRARELEAMATARLF